MYKNPKQLGVLISWITLKPESARYLVKAQNWSLAMEYSDYSDVLVVEPSTSI